MREIASLSDAERAELYRGYAEAMRKQAESASGSIRLYFLRIAESWEQLAGSIEQLGSAARTGPQKNPDPEPEAR